MLNCMGASVNIFKIGEIKKEKLAGKSLTIPQQQTLADSGLFDEIGTPKSILKKIKETNEVISFKVTHHSETQKKPVRIFWETLEENSPLGSKGTKEVTGGYQEIYEFPFIINLTEMEGYIFAKKDIANSFQKRLRKEGIMDLKNLKIDLAKLDDLPETNNIWGIWEDGIGRCKKKALFGVEVNKENQHDKEKATAYNLEYDFGDETIDLVISSTGGISSRSKQITEDDLLTIYNKLKNLNAIKDGTPNLEVEEEVESEEN